MLPNVYHQFKKFRNRELSVSDSTPDLDNGLVKKLVDRVYDDLGGYSPKTLVDVTHEPEGPWAMVYDLHKKYGVVIPDNLIKSYFSNHFISKTPKGVSGD